MSQKNLTIDDSFDFYPDIEILQRLAKGSSLKQNLPKAVRLWVILHSIYGSQTDPVKVELEKEFSYNDWCKVFFTDFEHHKNDKVPENHVAALVLEDGGDEDEAIAALLHDAVEDQGGERTRELIRQRFGERVIGIVLIVARNV